MLFCGVLFLPWSENRELLGQRVANEVEGYTEITSETAPLPEQSKLLGQMGTVD